MTKRAGLTRIEVIVLLAFCSLIAVWISVQRNLQSDRHDVRGPVRCSWGLQQIALGCWTYAIADRGEWPVPPHKPATATQPGGEVTYVRRIGAHRGGPSQPNAGQTTSNSTDVSTTRALWMLVQSGACRPADFTCPSQRNHDQPNTEDNPSAYWDFGVGEEMGPGMGTQRAPLNWGQVSYGYQVPFGRLGKPANGREEQMALVADKGPYGAWLESHAGGDPGVPKAAAGDPEKKWTRWNSPNHGGGNQNVAYCDGHVERHATPLAGVNKDNIYTQWSSFTPDENGRLQGKPPTLAGREVPMGETDSLIYP